MLDYLKENEVNSKVLRELIEGNESRRTELYNNFQKYVGDSLPIQNRVFDDPTKINSKLENQYRAEIVDQIVGYMFGNPVSYSIDDKYGSTYDMYKDTFDYFRTRNNIEDLDSETGIKMAACGFGVRLAYIDLEGNERLTDLNPWECIILEHDDEPTYSMRYWEYEPDQYKVEWYDSTKVYFFTQKKHEFILTGEQDHGFDYVPMWKIVNNEQEHSDFKKVETLIDAYDRLMSDAQNELEEFRLAYMYYKGFGVDEEEALKARRAGGFEIPEEGDIGFITKDINDVFLENHKKTISENIYKFSKTVDMSDEKFSGGTQSGESRKWKLLTLENRAITKERKFSKALRYQWKVLCSAFAKRGVNINYLDIYHQFKRNTPVELSHEADILMKLKGLVSDETRLSLASFIDDPQWEMNKMNEENEGLVDLEEVTENEE